MLKIKADKMKDLEKFGLKYDNFGFYHNNYNQKGKIIIDEDERLISVSGDKILDILYYIIKADMVEEVEDD